MLAVANRLARKIFRTTLDCSSAAYKSKPKFKVSYLVTCVYLLTINNLHAGLSHNQVTEELLHYPLLVS